MTTSTAARPAHTSGHAGPPVRSRGSGAISAASAVKRWAGRSGRWLARLLRPLTDPQRLLVLGWIVGLLMVGVARYAHADGIITGPDLAGGAPQTLFETYDFTTYQLTVNPDDENSGLFGGEPLLQIVGFVNNIILWTCLGILYGGLTLLEWFLNLNVYRDSASQIDAATQLVADQVFWPLIGATVAVGAFITYARWRGEGQGFLSDLGWVVAAAALAVGFAAGPSELMNTVDGLRQDVATGVISGAVQYTQVGENPTGFPTPQIGGEPQNAATRTLVDGVWNTFGATTWCFAQFHELDICKVAGAHALANDEQWLAWMQVLDSNGQVPEFGAWQDWIRGQDTTRTGFVLVLALITIPMAFMLLRLVVAGLVAALGFLLMLIVGLVFLTFWPIPGWFRETGTKYWVFTLGMQLQALFITVVIAAVMVVSTVISTQTDNFGFFIVALLNLGLFMAAAKARAWLEMLTSVGGGGSLGFAGALLARSALRTVVGGTAGALGLAATGARALFSARNRWPSLPYPALPNPNHGSKPFGLDQQGPTPPAPPFRPRPPGQPGLPGGRAPLPLPSSRTDRGGGVRVTRADAAGSGAGSARPGPGVHPRGPRQAGDAASRPPVVNPSPGRVWVDRPGEGLSPFNPAPPRPGRRVWAHRQGEGLSPLDPTPPLGRVPQRGGAYRITTARRPRRRNTPPE